MSGDYVCFIDSDDYVEQNYVEVLLSACKNNNADIAICNIKEIYEEAKKTNHLYKIKQNQTISKPDILAFAANNQYTLGLGPCNKLYEKSLFGNIRFPLIKMYEDSAIYFIIFDLAEKVVLLPSTLYNYVIRDGSTMHTPLDKERFDSILANDRIRLNFIRSKNNNELYRLEALRCLNESFYYYRQTKDKGVKKYIKQKFKSYKKEFKSIVNFWNAPLKLKIKMLYLKVF